MNGQVIDLVTAANNNQDFRHVLVTLPHSQVVLMNLVPGEDIGSEVHDLDQIIYIVSGTGKAILDGAEFALIAGSGIIVPQGVEHNVLNTGDVAMKIFTIYAPPEHADSTIHATKQDAVIAETSAA